MKLTAGACLLGSFLTACGPKAENQVPLSTDVAAQQGDTMRATALFEGGELARPQTLAVIPPWVLIGDIDKAVALHVIHAESGAYLTGWGRAGHGPGEFVNLWSIQPIDTSEVWLYDPGASRITKVNLNTIFAGDDHRAEQIVNLRGNNIALTAHKLNDGDIVATGFFSEGRVAFFNLEGTFRRHSGPLPSATKRIAAPVLQHAYSGTVVVNPHRSHFAIATRHADRVEIYLSDGSLTYVGRGPAGFDPVYEQTVRGGKPNISTGPDLRFGYVDAAAAGEHIYALYSGRTRGEPGKSHFGGEVHVFDWNGNLLRILPLDQRALALAVSPDERTLYTIRHDPIPAVLKYDLPEMEKPR